MLPLRAALAGGLFPAALLLTSGLISGCDEWVATATNPSTDQALETGPDFPSAGATFLHWDKGHGYQVAYYGAKHVWLWYPGNKAALRGDWAQEKIAGEYYLCFTYPRSSFNPVTGVLGGQKECQPQAVLERHLAAAKTGDVFGLSSGSVPYVLRKGRRPKGI